MNDRDRYLSTQRRLEEANKKRNAEMLKTLAMGLGVIFVIGIFAQAIL